MATFKHPLQKPVELKAKDTGEIVQRYEEFVFRDPTGADILAVGNPVIFDMAASPPKITHDEPKMSAMIARLANVPPLAVSSLWPQDWVECAWLITPFFVPRVGMI